MKRTLLLYLKTIPSLPHIVGFFVWCFVLFFGGGDSFLLKCISSQDENWSSSPENWKGVELQEGTGGGWPRQWPEAGPAEDRVPGILSCPLPILSPRSPESSSCHRSIFAKRKPRARQGTDGTFLGGNKEGHLTCLDPSRRLKHSGASPKGGGPSGAF